jgi:hypothetical protein
MNTIVVGHLHMYGVYPDIFMCIIETVHSYPTQLVNSFCDIFNFAVAGKFSDLSPLYTSSLA